MDADNRPEAGLWLVAYHCLTAKYANHRKGDISPQRTQRVAEEIINNQSKGAHHRDSEDTEETGCNAISVNSVSPW